tara:strand:+ start:1446 stop:1733 length:288 start_codon:yes stop_codon:yes gene_type:complete
MAKTKKQKLVDLKPQKVSEDHLKKVQSTVNSINRAQLDIGNIELRKHELLHGIAGLRDDLKAVQIELEKEYGTFDIDIQDGTINYRNNGKADKKN